MGRVTKPLTALEVKKAKPSESVYHLYDGGGLMLQVSPKGKKTWKFRFRENGKISVISLGHFPDFSLEDARKKSSELRVKISNGISIIRKKSNLFEDVAREWHKLESSNWTSRHAGKVLRYLEIYIFPFIGNVEINKLKTSDFLMVLKKIEDSGKLSTMHRCRSALSRMCAYAVACGDIDTNPVLMLSRALRPAKSTHFSSVITPVDVATALKKIWQYQGTFPVECALKIAPYVFMRPVELRTMRWDGIDFDKAEYHYHVGKTNIDQIVPLSRQVVAILKMLKPLTERGEWVFSSKRMPMSDSTINKALRSMGITSDILVGHGFRAMARTLLDEELGYRIDYIEQQLAHAVKDPLGRAYNRTTHLKARKEMMQTWADYLDRLRAS